MNTQLEPTQAEESADQPLYTPYSAARLCVLVFCIAAFVLTYLLALPWLHSFDASIKSVASTVGDAIVWTYWAWANLTL